MDEAMAKSGDWPNVAVMAGSDPAEVMLEHGQVIPDGEKYELADTREQLEADILAHYKTPEEKLKTVREWLDRQAAITERECMEQATTRYIGWDCAECAEGLGKELDARCDPLKERIAELTAELETYRKYAEQGERMKPQSKENGDTREKLEADIRAWHRDTPFSTKPSVQTLLGLLDRQEATTRAECKNTLVHFAERLQLVQNGYDAAVRDMQPKVEELTAELDACRMRERAAEDYDFREAAERWEQAYEDKCGEVVRLTAERDQLTNAINELQKKQPYCYNPEQPLDTLNTIGRYIDELTAERDQLKPKVDELNANWRKANDGWAGANAEAEQWRQKCDQLQVDLKAANDTINTLRASVAGLKSTVEKLKAAYGQKPADMGN